MVCLQLDRRRVSSEIEPLLALEPIRVKLIRKVMMFKLLPE